MKPCTRTTMPLGLRVSPGWYYSSCCLLSSPLFLVRRSRQKVTVCGSVPAMMMLKLVSWASWRLNRRLAPQPCCLFSSLFPLLHFFVFYGYVLRTKLQPTRSSPVEPPKWSRLPSLVGHSTALACLARTVAKARAHEWAVTMDLFACVWASVCGDAELRTKI